MKSSTAWAGMVAVVASMGLLAGCAADGEDEDTTEEQGETSEDLSSSKSARCVVKSLGEATFKGACKFHAEKGGSFAVTPAKGKFFGDISSISVDITSAGKAEVRGIHDGINSRWGSAKRSTSDGACWVGADFTVCAY